MCWYSDSQRYNAFATSKKTRQPDAVPSIGVALYGLAGPTGPIEAIENMMLAE
jgi:hypothetical protein